VMTLIRRKQNEDVAQNLINWSKGAHGPYYSVMQQNCGRTLEIGAQ
jgi:hypothetical protein